MMTCRLDPAMQKSSTTGVLPGQGLNPQRLRFTLDFFPSCSDFAFETEAPDYLNEILSLILQALGGGRRLLD